MPNPLVLACVTAMALVPSLLPASSAQTSFWLAQAAPAAIPLHACPVTSPNGSTPPGERPSRGHHGDDRLWTALWPEGTIVFRPGGSGFVLKDGSLQMKFPWWRGLQGPLTIDGRRLDATAPALRARIPSGYGPSGFQATSLIFPTPGCWEVTGHVGAASLRFVVNVVKIGEGPLQNGLP
jgi:hypothetical protein